MRRILLTGFEPFGGDPINPSWEAVQLVGERWRGDAELITAQLPTVFGRGGSDLAALIERHQPDIVVATGVAAGRTAITPERVAFNQIEARIPDNDGAQPTDCPVVPDGPASLPTTLPVDDMIAALRQAGIAAEPSDSAGRFVCNELFYGLMHAEARSVRPRRAGFIHVPASPGAMGDGVPTMALETIANGLLLALEAILARVPEVEVGER
jgi:pyroglutamyl-peptidase